MWNPSSKVTKCVIESAVVQCAKSNSVVGSVCALRVFNWHDMCAFD